MNNRILLTYKNREGLCTYGWFESINDIDQFMVSEESEDVVELLECIDCTNANNIDLNELGKE